MSWKQLIIILLILYWFAEFTPMIIEGISGGVEAQLFSHHYPRRRSEYNWLQRLFIYLFSFF